MTPLPKFRARPNWKPSKPRPQFLRKGKPRSSGISLRKEKPFCLPRNTRTQAAAGLQRSGRRFNRIGKHWLSKPAIVYRGEREICNPKTDEGRAEYKWRTLLLWVRQDGWCCFREYDFCPGRLKLSESTFEHEGKRGGGRQDDRISYFDKAGKERPMNGAAHLECNSIAGSRRLPIWHGNLIFQKENAA